ncbi:hypothetical protein [Pseudoxanthomonas sp. CF125]|uniref:hypothetical protein n=1 Tax=Pseudoxanthomonas sp. CF125 TaxID=1855303 RepID=UPI0015A068EE|nr:hypothetical protein [Pseudoxanthomonas sp. CF125]
MSDAAAPGWNRMGERMKQRARLLLAALLALACGDAMACRMAGYVWPTSIQLATSSEWVFIMHVNDVLPLSPSEAAFASSAFESVPAGIPFRFPTEKAQVSLLRSLKGDAPATAVVESSVEGCSGVSLQSGGDYLVFANPPETGDGVIAPIKGSFKLGNAYAQTELQKIENHLTLQAMKP